MAGAGTPSLLGNVTFVEGSRRLLYAVTPKETSFAHVRNVPDYLNEAVPFFLGAIALEYILSFLINFPKSRLRLNDAFSSISAGVFSQLSKIIVLSAELALYMFVYNNFHLVTLPWDNPWTWYLCFIGVDFLYYWFHRATHGRNPYCIDKNYGGTLIIWDRIFGTFQAETDEEIAYGLVHLLASWDPMWIQLCHFSHIWKTFWETPGVKNKLSVIFKGPSWSPGKPRLGDPADRPEIECPVQKYDSSLSYWGNLYVLVHFLVAIVAYQLLIARRMVMSQLHVVGVVSYFLFTITSVGALFDNKWYAPYMELFRCLLFLIVDVILSSQNLDTGVSVLPTNYISVIRGIFIASALFWLTGSLLSTKKSKTE